jgi:hypothetical protein
MYTQQIRRQAVVNAHYASPNVILRESNHTSGFTNGVLEIYSITSICQRVCAAVVDAVCNPVLDGRDAAAEICEILDGNGGTVVLDGGTSQTVVC